MVYRNILTEDSARLNYGITELDLASYRLKPSIFFPGASKSWSVEDFTLCVIMPVIFWNVIIICSYDWWLSSKSIHLIQNPLIISHVTRICDNTYKFWLYVSRRCENYQMMHRGCLKIHATYRLAKRTASFVRSAWRKYVRTYIMMAFI
jgi:hypothetical protein